MIYIWGPRSLQFTGYREVRSLCRFPIPPTLRPVYTRVASAPAYGARQTIRLLLAQFLRGPVFRVGVGEAVLIRAEENLCPAADRFQQPLPRNRLPAMSAEALKVFHSHCLRCLCLMFRQEIVPHFCERSRAEPLIFVGSGRKGFRRGSWRSGCAEGFQNTIR